MAEPKEQPEERPLSKVTPSLVASLLCDAAVTDPSTGKSTLVGVFDRLYARKVPTRRPIAVYVRLTDAEGHYDIFIKVVHLDSSAIVAEGGLQAEFEERLTSYDAFVRFQSVPLPEYGRYEFQVWANGEYLGGTTLDVIPFPVAEEPKEKT